jgi:hypothetical protein
MYFDTLIVKDGKYHLMRRDSESRGGPEILKLIVCLLLHQNNQNK